MYFEDSKKLYKAIEVARIEGKQSDQISVNFTYYDLDGTKNESRSRYYTKIFSTVLSKYEYMQTLPEDHFLSMLSIGDATETDTSQPDGTRINYDIFEACLYMKGFKRHKIMIGYDLVLEANKDQFMEEARTVKKDFQEYAQKRNGKLRHKQKFTLTRGGW